MCCSVVICCGLLARQESSNQLMDLVFFGLVLIDIIKCISFCDRRAKEFEVSEYFVNIFVLFLIEKCVVQSTSVEANLLLVVKLQPDLIMRAILEVASILRKKSKLR